MAAKSDFRNLFLGNVKVTSAKLSPEKTLGNEKSIHRPALVYRPNPSTVDRISTSSKPFKMKYKVLDKTHHGRWIDMVQNAKCRI